MNELERKAQVFISYAHEDLKVSQKIEQIFPNPPGNYLSLLQGIIAEAAKGVVNLR